MDITFGLPPVTPIYRKGRKIAEVAFERSSTLCPAGGWYALWQSNAQKDREEVARQLRLMNVSPERR